MKKIFRELESGQYSVKGISFWGVLGLLFKVMLVEIFAVLVLMPFGTVFPDDSLAFVIISEIFSKGLVLWMLIRFYKEDQNQLVLGEIMEDAFPEEFDKFNEEEVVIPKHQPRITSRKIFAGTIILGIIGFRFFYDNSISYFLTENIPVDEEIVEAFETLFSWPVYAIFSIVVIAPFYEELLFRKFMLGGLLKKVKPVYAILISSFFFALIHMNWLQGINAFILGIIAGWIYYKTESISLSIFAHFVNNFYALSIGILHETFLSEPVLWANGLLCFAGGMFILFAKRRLEKLVEESSLLEI